MHCWFGSRRQLMNRIGHGLADLVQFLPVHPPIEGSAYIGAGQPELDVIGLVGHGVLVACIQNKYIVGRGRGRGRGRRTLIIVSRMLTDPKTALAGVTLDTSFARFIASMAVFNAERAPSCRFGWWEFESMAKTRGRRVKAGWWQTVRKVPSPDKDKRTHLMGARL